jgi:hypothetical protein
VGHWLIACATSGHVIVNRFRTDACQAAGCASPSLDPRTKTRIGRPLNLLYLRAQRSYETSSTIEMATQSDIDRSQERQDRGIKKEFQTMRTYVDVRFEEQRTYVDGRFEEQRTYMDRRFEEQRTYMDRRFEEQRTYTDGRFEEQRSYMDDRFQQVEALMMNSKAASSWHDIVPIRILNSSAVPPNFPNKVVKFWRLQRPRNQHQLIELLRFYGIRASDLTTPISDDEEEEEEESDSLSESQSTLEEAVRANLTFALARLAAQLGLDYGSISHNMGLYEQIQQTRIQQAAQRTKREQSSEDGKDKGLGRSVKKAATPLDVRPQRNRLGIPIEELTKDYDELSYKSPTVLSHVGYAPRPKTDSPTSRVSGSSSKKRATTPSEPSGASTIPFTQQS